MALFLVLLITNVQTHQVHGTSGLFVEDLNPLEGKMKTNKQDGIKMIHLSNAEMISTTIEVDSSDVSLIGKNTILEYCVDSRRSEMENEPEDRKFMFSVWNSSFRVSGVRALCMSTESGLCVVSSSNVYLSLSSVISDGFHSPFLIHSSTDGNDGSSSSIVLSWCTHESPRHFVAPFVDVSHSRNDGELAASRSKLERIVEPQSISVVGTGLTMTSQTLWMGTGPLFSFGMVSDENRVFETDMMVSMDTTMSFCSLANMSSLTNRIRDLDGTKNELGFASQRIVGSSVCMSRNHDQGTGMLDVNLGGSLSCLNASFSSCVREPNSETEKVESFQDFIQGDRFYFGYNSKIQSVSYTLCTFKDMAVSTSYTNGGAINFYQPKGPLCITQCFFHNCRATGYGSDGGAVLVSCQSVPEQLATISNSSFTECKTSTEGGYSCGGGLVCWLCSHATIVNCFCESCYAQWGGAMDLAHEAATVTNCAFVLCSTYAFGGALRFETTSPMDLSFLQFRQCSCSGIAASRDINFYDMTSEVANSDNIKYCDSTSGSPNVYFEFNTSSNSILIPQQTTEQRTDISSFEVSMGENKATITVTTTTEVKGTMGILLEGSNVPRLIHVEFGTPTTKSSTGTVEVSVGRQGVLPILNDGESYTNRSWSFAHDYFPPSIIKLSAGVEWTTEGKFTLTGHLLKSGTYSMKVKDKDDKTFTISLSLSDNRLTGTNPLSSKDPSKMKYGYDYTVIEVLCDSEPLLLAPSLSCTIPYPTAKLTDIFQTDGRDSMKIVFDGYGFVASGYTVTVTEVGVEESPHTKTVQLVPYSSYDLREWTAKLYPISEADLKYGTEYEVSSIVSLDGKQTATTSSRKFTTPKEPAQIETYLKAELINDKTAVRLSFESDSVC
ncbi:hypothetical protein BLNAU_18788 [Blattamonas nauphoetae]|uniref:Uncharacterized protein n=1 Tax=Blattamonas nauphoetae TaxID=2049346 RepID=A0ABQ9X3K8_9EUKA|nr:hypothetical protein BLNAU_18788 [Blattamonas nauphoetae]